MLTERSGIDVMKVSESASRSVCELLVMFMLSDGFGRNGHGGGGWCAFGILAAMLVKGPNAFCRPNELLNCVSSTFTGRRE